MGTDNQGAPIMIYNAPTPRRVDHESPLSTGMQRSPWPEEFKMPTLEAYKGDTDPRKFLHVYEIIVEAAGGDNSTKAKRLPLALQGVALSWFFTLAQ